MDRTRQDLVGSTKHLTQPNLIVNRFAYQLAENMPKERHDSDCDALGLGLTVTKINPTNLCTCWVIHGAVQIMSIEYERVCK